MKYIVNNDYTLEAEDRSELLEKIVEKEKITIEKILPSSGGGFVFLSQGDNEWRKIKLGDSDETIGRSGCLITSLSMLSYWYGKYRDPAWMAKKLNFNPGGWLLWLSINEIDLPFRFVWRRYGYDKYKILEILKSEDRACVVELNDGAHWGAVIGYSRLNGFRIADPIDGNSVYAKKRDYRITGHAEITRKY